MGAARVVVIEGFVVDGDGGQGGFECALVW